MFKLIIDKFKNLDEKVRKILNIGLKFSFIVSALSILILFLHIFYQNLLFLEIAISIFKLGLFFMIEFIICALAIDIIRNGVNK